MRIADISSRKAEITVAFAALFAAAAAIIVIGPQRTDFSDSGDYINAAQCLLRDGFYPEQGTLPFFRAPLYPVMLAGVWWILPGSVIAVKVVQAILHSITAIIVYRSGLGIFGSKNAAFAGAIIAAVNPLLLYSSAAIQTEVLHTVLIAAAVYFSAVGILLKENNKPIYAIIAGIAFGLAALCRPSAIGIGALTGFLIFVFLFRTKRNVLPSILLLAGMALTITPWTARNYARFGEIILVNDAGGYSLWVGNHPANLRFYDGSLRTAKDIGEYSDWIGKTLSAEMIANWEATEGYSRKSPGEREALWRKEAIANFWKYPKETIELFGWKFLGFWKPVPSSEVFGLFSTVTLIFEIPVLIFGILGLLLSYFQLAKREIAVFFAIYLIAITAVHVALVATVRMRVPYVEPWMAMFAGYALVTLFEKRLVTQTNQ
jgi:asparagine N-glycosylation enzyme membrane subunit Stt3